MSYVNYRLKVYMQALEALRSKTEADWLNEWAEVATNETVYLTKEMWEGYLKECMIKEIYLMEAA